MPTLSNGIVYQDLGTHDAAEYAEYARQERERRRQAQQNAVPSPQPAPQQNSAPKTVPDRGPDVKTAPGAPMDAAEQTRRSQLQDGARSAYENYLGSYASQAQNEEKNIAQTGKSVMDTAYVFNEAWNAVKNNTAFAGNIEQQQAFVTNAAISFANASAVAHGWELVDQANIGGKNAWTGYNSQTGTWDFVFKDKNGQYFTKHTTMDQVASQLKNNGYYPDDADKSKDKGGKGGDETPASTGKGGETKPPAEQSYNDYDKRYGGFYTDTFDENGKKTGTRLTDEGETLMLEELKTATGRERTYLLNQLAWKQAHEAFADDQKNGNPQNRKFENEKDAFKSALESLKNEYADPATQKPDETNAAPTDALEAFAKSGAFAKSVSVGKTGDADIQYSGLGASFKRLDDARKQREENRKAAAEQSRRPETVYYNGKWIDAKNLPENAKTTGVTSGATDASPEAVRIAREMTRKNFEANPTSPSVKDTKLVSDFDAMLKRYNDEDDETIRQFEQGDTLLSERKYLDNIRKQDIAREKEMLAVVREMSPKQRQAILRERDDQGHFTERARRMRSALLYARDMGNIRRTMNGAPVSEDASENDRDAEVAALAAVDTNEARRKRAEKASTPSETKKPEAEVQEQEPASQEQAPVASSAPTQQTAAKETEPPAQSPAPSAVAEPTEPAASEPENKPEPKPEPNPYGKEPLPEDPIERQEAVRSDKNYKSIVESEDGDGGYVLTDRAMATLRQKGIPVGYMTRDRVQNWIHNGDKYLDKHAAALKRIEDNNKAENEREKARAREEVRRNQEAQQRSMTATSVNRLIAGAGIDITRQSDEDLLLLFPKKAEYEYAVQLRDRQRKQKKTVR